MIEPGQGSVVLLPVTGRSCLFRLRGVSVCFSGVGNGIAQNDTSPERPEGVQCCLLRTQVGDMMSESTMAAHPWDMQPKQVLAAGWRRPWWPG